MNDKILVTPESLEEKAGQLRKMKAEQATTFDSVEDLINGLVAGWEGEAQEAFVNSYNTKKSTFEQFLKDIESLARRMHNFAVEIRDNERRAVNKLNGVKPPRPQ